MSSSRPSNTWKRLCTGPATPPLTVGTADDGAGSAAGLLAGDMAMGSRAPLPGVATWSEAARRVTDRTSRGADDGCGMTSGIGGWPARILGTAPGRRAKPPARCQHAWFAVAAAILCPRRTSLRRRPSTGSPLGQRRWTVPSQNRARGATPGGRRGRLPPLCPAAPWAPARRAKIYLILLGIDSWPASASPSAGRVQVQQGSIALSFLVRGSQATACTATG